MLTAIELANFKGISSGQRIEFAPITLLFGANSAGKSTILDSLLYLSELLERGDADVDRTEVGGQVAELGGFARLVHRHERDRTIYIKAEFPTPGTLERFGRAAEEVVADLDDAVETAWVELLMRERVATGYQGPVVDRVVIGIGSDPQPLVWLELGETLREGEPLLARINLGHPVLGESGPNLAEHWSAIAIAEPEPPEGHEVGDWSFPAGVPLLVFAISRSRMSALPPLDEPVRVISAAEETALEHEEAARQVRVFLEMVVLGTLGQLASTLRRTLYIGPLRAIPARGLLYERATRTSSWGDGVAAWEELLADRQTLVSMVNSWLRRLRAGCEVVVQDLFDPGSTAEAQGRRHTDATARRLLLRTESGGLVQPSEVGAGISQLIPVIVAALVEGSKRLVAVEQPELHVHPALQARLGDLLIWANKERWFLIETHSEHLILRLLRRIRETHERSQPGESREKHDALRARRNSAAHNPGDGDADELSNAAEELMNHPSFHPDKLSVLYIESSEAGVRVTKLRVGDDGEFLDLWPKGFFDERFEELYGAP